MSIDTQHVTIERGTATGRATWTGFCFPTVAFTSNGFQGGDGGHGGFVEIVLDAGAAPAFEAHADDKYCHGVQNLTLRFEGDDEIEAAAALFAFLGAELPRA